MYSLMCTGDSGKRVFAAASDDGQTIEEERAKGGPFARCFLSRVIQSQKMIFNASCIWRAVPVPTWLESESAMVWPTLAKFVSGQEPIAVQIPMSPGLPK